MTTARILVVDDEPAVAKLVSSVLAKRGYEVFFETDAYRAIELATNGLRIDLIVSDVIMPRIKGPELIRTVQRHSPSVLGVLMSGYTGEEHREEFPLIHKPFSADELVAAVSRALDRAGDQGTTTH